MTYISACSGIEAASVAWLPLGWSPLWFSEIDQFCCALLKRHYPNVPNIGDMTHVRENDVYNECRGAADIFVAGTPCQSFSAAGNRRGLADPRGQLALWYINILHDYQPRWCIWENVQGVFSANQGEDFKAFIRALTECGYSLCWRVLDGRDFGTPQPRKRVFVVGYFGDWRAPAAVLLEPASNQRPDKKSKSAGNHSSRLVTKDVLFNLHSQGSRIYSDKQGCSLSARAGGVGGNTGIYKIGEQLRVLTPLEAERLMGFPDGYTSIETAPNSARYKALGNSIIPAKLEWLGRRIEAVEKSMALRNCEEMV